MMYIADLHIHSRYSRATSRDCTPEYLDLWARRKGISIVGTGDFTHPAWRKELEEKLEPAEDGLYVLKEEYRIKDETVGASVTPRFVITGEISSIYKKHDRVRKVHSVILLPGLEAAECLSRKLETIGNIHSDGRPILGLDCHDLLEIMLELNSESIYIPAHIWTPHFSLFGAFSGFDTVEECYEDLTPYIHAMETGLSSDPPMNWRLSALDSYQLVSNSDAHSPAKLGREANLLDMELSYQGLQKAIQTGEGLAGTIEFFPEEGKYHYDGHRKCHLCLSPLEAEKYSGKCPVCGRKLTIGVSHRVEQLADREEGFVLPGAKAFESLVPLPEVIAASTGHSVASRKVENQYRDMLSALGSEFAILRELPIEDIRKVSGRLTAEGIRRLREGKVERLPGYDGEYGTIRLFDQMEREEIDGQLSLFTGAEMAELSHMETAAAVVADCTAVAVAADSAAVAVRTAAAEGAIHGKEAEPESDQPAPGLNLQQEAAVTAIGRAINVVAGPGTGKTKTLVSHAFHLLKERGVKPTELTAVTFTNQAAREMHSRLEGQLGGKRFVSRMRIGTFHSICYDLLKKSGMEFTLADEVEMKDTAEEIIAEMQLNLSARQFLRQISAEKCGLEKQTETCPKEAYQAYQKRLKEQGILDFDDLLLETLHLFEEDGKNKTLRQGFSYLLVDEFQDISPVQYRLIREWNKGGRELFVIGDPDQAIYSFRGSDERCFEKLKEDWPNVTTICLEQNYRSTPQILDVASNVISQNRGQKRRLIPQKRKGVPVRLVTAAGEMSEDIFAAKEINRLIGGIDMLDAQGHQEMGDGHRVRSFSEIAVLYRTNRQAELLETCLKKEGIPYVVAGREDFLMEPAVRGTICFFKALLNPEDRAARRLSLKLLWKLPEDGISEGIFDGMAETYRKKIKREKPQKVLEAWISDMNLQEEEGVAKLAAMSVFYKNMQEFLDNLTFGQESDLKRCGGKTYTSDSVTLMTLHGSKGLEFPVVLMCGVRKGLIPLESGRQEIDEAEERRLFYVGMTRAKEELILITSQEASPFLKDIPEDVTERENAGKQRDPGMGKQMSLFDFNTFSEGH